MRVFVSLHAQPVMGKVIRRARPPIDPLDRLYVFGEVASLSFEQRETVCAIGPEAFKRFHSSKWNEVVDAPLCRIDAPVTGFS